MKKIILALALLLASAQTFAQVGIGTTEPHASAVLDMVSTTKGFLPPRLDNSERDGITNPPQGLLIYNTDEKCIQTALGTGTGNWSDCLGAAAAAPCPTTANATIIGAPVGKTCGASQISLTSSYTGADSYSWSADSGATFVDDSVENPILILPDADVNVNVSLTIGKTSCTPSSFSVAQITIDVDPAVAAEVTGVKCLDVEVTDHPDDPLAARIGIVDDFTNLLYTVGTSTGATGFTWAWLSNPGGNGVINSGGNTHTADVTFNNKGLAAVGTYVLQVTMTGLTCGTMVRTITVTIQDNSCFCPTTIIDVFGADGVTKWMDRNLGAKQAATSATDFNAYGCLFQWGRQNDGHADINWTSATAGTPVNGTTRTRSTTDTPTHGLFIEADTGNVAAGTPNNWKTTDNATLWQGSGGTNNNPCPTGYSIPTVQQWQVEITAIGNSDTVGNSMDNNISNLKLPANGNRNTVGDFQVTGTRGRYWSSTVTVGGFEQSERINLSAQSNSTSNINPISRANGMAVRCIKD